jgi:dTDP-glucose 4,6-dehydratase
VAVSVIVQEDIKTIVSRVGAGFDRLNGKNLLITGGTGFVGSYLLETVAYLNDHLLSKACHLYAVTRNPQKVSTRFPHLVRRPEFTLIEGDVRKLLLPPVPWNFVIHAAAPSDARIFVQDPLDTLDTIVGGTKAVLAAAAEAGVEAFLMISSGAVYGQQPAECKRLREDYSGAPDLHESRSAYGEAKRCAELLCHIYWEQKEVPVSIARIFTLVGPCQDLNSTSAVIDFIRQGLVGDTITIHDDGQAVRSYCYIADAVTALWKLLLSHEVGEVVNVGADLEAISFRDLAYRVGLCLGKAVTVEVQGGSGTGVLGRRYAPDMSRLYETLGFRPATTLDEALSRTIEWMREQRIEGVTTV